MDDWNYCVTTLPKVSRTFALNISVLKGDLHKSILVAYLFCRTIDTVEDACKLESSEKIKLLLHFASILKDTKNRNAALDKWVKNTYIVDGSPADIDLLKNIQRVFNIFDSIQKDRKQYIISSVCTMAQGMAYFQKKKCTSPGGDPPPGPTRRLGEPERIHEPGLAEACNLCSPHQSPIT